jgi:hypothetical protein
LKKNHLVFFLESAKQLSRAGRVAQVVERLPSKCEALNLSPSTTKKKKKKRNQLSNAKYFSISLLWLP